MQKLKNERGSILVSAVVVALLVTMISVGFLQINSSAINNGNAMLENEKAFQAAEAGVFAASNWLASQAIFPGITTATNPFSGSVDIGEFRVYDTITPLVGGKASITSVVYKGSSFMAKIRVNDVQALSVNQYTTYFNEHYSSDPVNTWGGFRGFVFNGRFHMNDMFIRIDNESGPSGLFPTKFRNGLVTVARNSNNSIINSNSLGLGCGNQQYCSKEAKIGHFGNNYDWGVDATSNFVYAGKSPLTVSELDRVFESNFVSQVDPVSLSSIESDGTSMNTSMGFTKVSLDSSIRDEGSENSTYRPTLTFLISSGQARYQYEYRDVMGSYRNISGTYNSNTVFISKNNLNVKGTVRGTVTVATTTGKDICPVGNLIVEGYTGVVPENNSNIIGLASGRHIRLNNQYLVRSYMSDQVRNVSALTTAGMMQINASLMALRRIGDEKGCLYVSDTYGLDYGLKIWGNQIMRAYRSTRYGFDGTTQRWTCGLAENPFIINVDSRFVDKNKIPPGFPQYVKTQRGNLSRLVLTLKDWQEINRP